MAILGSLHISPPFPPRLDTSTPPFPLLWFGPFARCPLFPFCTVNLPTILTSLSQSYTDGDGSKVRFVNLASRPVDVRVIDHDAPDNPETPEREAEFSLGTLEVGQTVKFDLPQVTLEFDRECASGC